MVAAWAPYKRHHRFFAGLSKLRRQGMRPRVLLLGYPVGFTKDDILKQASYYGVDDQLEIREWVPYDQVGEQVSRAKVNVIWSRKEGVNRAIIEAMFADVPCILRKGFNYGYEYPYMNEQTGRFATEEGLPETIRWMLEHHEQFSPRAWVMANMTCQKATETLADVIRRTAAANGERWTEGLAVKVNKLHGMDYWEASDRQRFEGDYDFLRSLVVRT
jgi:glycosyltransferase involved in cell wall biosynthesis